MAFYCVFMLEFLEIRFLLGVLGSLLILESYLSWNKNKPPLSFIWLMFARVPINAMHVL